MRSVSARQAARGAMDVLNSLQIRFTAEEQCVGVAAVFLTLCDHFQVRPEAVFETAVNVMRATNDEGRPEFRAVKHYAENEL